MSHLALKIKIRHKLSKFSLTFTAKIFILREEVSQQMIIIIKEKND
jgi:hypothetical protein